jgi:hypothetical protein
MEVQKRIAFESLMNNMKQTDLFQTIIYIVGGIMSGIFGLTGMNGLFLFIFISIISVSALQVWMKFDHSNYINISLFDLAVMGITNQVMSFVLFWTLSYALVHIY